MNDTRITLSVLMLRKNHAVFKDHGGDKDKRFLGNMLYQSTRRSLTMKEADKVIETLKKVRV